MTAAVRKSPTVANGGSDVGTTYTVNVSSEIEALWKVSLGWLISVGGTANAITATTDTTIVAAITAYARPMGFYLKPVSDNTSATTLSIDSVGAISLRDASGTALSGGELATSSVYPVVFDGTYFRALTVTSGSAASVSSAPNAIIHDRKASGTAGGTFTSGAWRQRTLNTSTRNNISGSSLASNQLTLPAGTYYVEWSCTGYNCNNHRSRLYNATDTSTIEYSVNEYANASSTRSSGSSYFTLTSSKALEIDHQCQTTTASNGLGVAASFGIDEIYCELSVWKQ